MGSVEFRGGYEVTDEMQESAIEDDLQNLEDKIRELSEKYTFSPKNQEEFDKILAMAENPEDQYIKKWLALLEELDDDLARIDLDEEDTVTQYLYNQSRNALQIGTH